MTKSNLDKYYTHQKDIEMIFNLISSEISFLDKGNVELIEPSAGDGRFCTPFIDGGFSVKSFDISPDVPWIEPQDFLELNLEEKTRKRVFFGNPPFGKSCSLAIKFFNKCAELDADMICFILPSSFGKKLSFRKRLDDRYSLYKEYSLNDGLHFERPDGKEYEGVNPVSCKFMMFVKFPRKSVDIPKTTGYTIQRPSNKKLHEEVDGKKVSKEQPVGEGFDADFTIVTHSTKAGTVEDFDGKTQKVSVRQFVKVHECFDIDIVRDKFEKTDFTYFLEAATIVGSQSSISTDEIKCCVENSDYKLEVLAEKGYSLKKALSNK